jgi:4-aminobutyrate--pyruvate transaminase
VICGFGRLGTPFGCQKYGFTPDIMTLSKQITSSYMPFAAVMFSDASTRRSPTTPKRSAPFGHGFTATGHPVSCAVALENLAIIEERDLMGNAARLEAQFQAGLQSFADHPLVGEARGAGLIGAVELVADKKTRRPFEKIGKAGALASTIGHEEGLIFRAIGDQLALCPPHDRHIRRRHRDHDPHGPHADRLTGAVARGPC